MNECAIVVAGILGVAEDRGNTRHVRGIMAGQADRQTYGQMAIRVIMLHRPDQRQNKIELSIKRD